MPITAIYWLSFSPIRRCIIFEIDFEAFSIHGICSLLTLACTFIATIFIEPWFKVRLVSWKQIAYSLNYCAWDKLNGCKNVSVCTYLPDQTNYTSLWYCSKYWRNGSWFSIECSVAKLELFSSIEPLLSFWIRWHISESLKILPRGVFQAPNADIEMKLDVLEACSVPINIIVLFFPARSCRKNLWHALKSWIEKFIIKKSWS